MSPESPDTLTIQLDEGSKIYYAGVAAGVKAGDELEAATAGGDLTFAQRLSFFWLSVGTQLAQRVPNGQDDLVSKFVLGAKLREPSEQHVPFTLRIDTTDTVAFGYSEDEEGGDVDEQVAQRQVAKILRHAADEVESGEIEGRLVDELMTRVGSYKLDLYGM